MDPLSEDARLVVGGIKFGGFSGEPGQVVGDGSQPGALVAMGGSNGDEEVRSCALNYPDKQEGALKK